MPLEPTPTSARPTPLPVLALALALVVIPIITVSQLAAHLRLDVVDDQMFGYYGWRIAHGATVYHDVWDNKPPGIYWINAVDPRKGTMAWRIKTPSPMYAAITATAGDLLFTGDLEGNFLALDARNGQELYRFNTGGPIAGGVVTWQQKGRQYVAVASGHSGGSIPVSGSTTIVVFGQ